MTNGNDCAYPADSKTQTEGGLTKREYLAAIFTAAYINNPQNGNPLNAHGNAEAGIMQADILITELNKTNNENK